MRITRRTSGGRGEYEVSEVSPSGLRPADLQAKELLVDLGGDIVIATSTTVSVQGAKPRLRILSPTPSSIHLHRQVTAALLMPHPAREDSVLAGGLPVMRNNQYAIEHIVLNDADARPDGVVLFAAEMVLRNFSYHAESLDIHDRVSRLRKLWTRRNELPAPLSELIASHEAKVMSGGALDVSAERIVQSLQNKVTDLSENLGTSYRTAQEDVLPDLEKALNISVPPAPPASVSEIDPNETVIKRRVIKDWKRWANSRGSASAVFRQAVRQAYKSTCVVCGYHLPITSMNASPGVDAAHILPWADYDLDVVSNGLCLCKLHHWAFDEGLIGFFESKGVYRVELMAGVLEALSDEAPNFATAALIAHCGEIPAHRLPPFAKDWPSPKFLQVLRESQ